MKHIVASFNKKILVVMIPGEFQIDPSRRLKYQIPVALSPDELSLPHKEFQNFFDKEEIEVIDLLPIFLEHKTENLYLPIDGHLSITGNLTAATAISDKLIQTINND